MSVEVIEKIEDEVPKEWRDLGCKRIWIVFIGGDIQAVFFTEADARWYARAIEESLQQELENDNPPRPGPRMG